MLSTKFDNQDTAINLNNEMALLTEQIAKCEYQIEKLRKRSL